MTAELYFYQLAELDPPQIIARVCARAKDVGWRCAILAPSEQHAAISKALWTTQPDSFLAHEIAPHSAEAPIIITDTESYKSIATGTGDGAIHECVLMWEPIEVISGLKEDTKRLCYFFSQNNVDHLSLARAGWKTATTHEHEAKYLVYDQAKWKIQAQHPAS